jgi:hypothetical protein
VLGLTKSDTIEYIWDALLVNAARVGATQMRESFYYAYALNKDGVLTG